MDKLNLFNDKIMVVLEHFLSLHEAEDIYDAIFDDIYTVEDIATHLNILSQNKNQKEIFICQTKQLQNSI